MDKCFVYYGGVFIKSAFDGMMGLCKYLYDNREDIKDGAKTAASAVGPAIIDGAKIGATVGADVLIATPGVLLDIFRGVDALGMKFATWYNPPDNGLKEIMDKVKQRNEEHHKMMAKLAAEQGVEATRATNKTMALKDKKFELEQEVASMNAIKAAKDAATNLNEGLSGEITGLEHMLVMGEVHKGKDKAKAKKAIKASKNPSKSTMARFQLTGMGAPSAVAVPVAVPEPNVGEMDQSDSDDDGLGGGGKRATRKRGKRSSKRGSRKTKTTRKKTTRKKTTRKKRRGKK